MSGKSISVRNKKTKGKTDWHRVNSLSEREIISAAKGDQDAKPLSKAELKKFKRVYPLKEINVKLIRTKLQLSQDEFAGYFGVSIRTLQEWEQNRRIPTATARNFLRVIEQEPAAVLRALSGRKVKNS